MTKILDWNKDNRAASLLKELQEAKKQKSYWADKEKVLSQELKDKLSTADGAKLQGYEITKTITKPYQGKLITAEMVGTYQGARSGSERVTIKEIPIEQKTEEYAWE